MRRLSTQADLIKEGERLASAIQANTADLAHLQTQQDQLGTMVEDLQELVFRQGALTAEKQEVSKQIQMMTETCSKLIAVVRKAVRFHYGSRSEKLPEFGLLPFRGRGRRSTETPSPPTPAIE
jgi:hypothetical protein